MGGGEPGRSGSRRRDARVELTGAAVGTEPAEVTVEDLKRWEDHGAMWRPVEISDELVVVELCSCFGEPMDMVQGTAPELIEFVRRQRDQPL